MYVTADDYLSLYGDIDGAEFNRLALEADRVMDRYTTGIDNVRKLTVAYPEKYREIITACECKVVNVLKQLSDAEASAASARGYEETENGLKGRAVSSMSAGNESVSFSASSETGIDKAVSDISERKRLLESIVVAWLSGLEDANGVNLLYMGRYPVRIDNV